jgi:hypothetical protein
MSAIHEEIQQALSGLQDRISAPDGIACSRMVSTAGRPVIAGEIGIPCTRQFDGVDRQGRLKLWFDVDCEIPRKHFCDGCLAYWLIAVARNMVIRDGQWADRIASEKAERAAGVAQ